MRFALPLVFVAACTQPSELAMEHMRRGDKALADGKYSLALAAYNHARELSPTDANVQRALMKVRVHLVAEQPARLGTNELEEARYEAQLLLDTDKPREIVYMTALGNVLAKTGDVDGAKAKLNEALKVDPSSALAHVALGQVLMATRDGASQAKSEFEAALRTKPDSVNALVGLAQLKLAEGDGAGAATSLEAALKVSDEIGVRMLLGQAKMTQQKPADAVEHFRRAVQFDNKNADALGSLGQALLGAGKPDEAERPLRAALQLRADSGTTMALGFALNQQKKGAEALGAFNQILAQEPGSAPALFGAATANELVGKKDDAIDEYRRLMAIQPDAQQRQFVSGLQRDAQARLTALAADATVNAPNAPNAAGSATPAAGPAAGPPPGTRGAGPLVSPPLPRK